MIQCEPPKSKQDVPQVLLSLKLKQFSGTFSNSLGYHQNNHSTTQVKEQAGQVHSTWLTPTNMRFFKETL